jgi:myo-inositol 2-dehydrogenase / D-chiro-inositol 1-dehydrogenase
MEQQDIGRRAMKDQDQTESKFGRRDFLGAAGAASFMIMKPHLVFGTAANSAIRLGLLGCGHRGTAVATSFANNTTARVTALGDLFQDQLDKAKEHFDGIAAKKGYAAIDRKLMFKGARAYQEIAHSAELDMIQISTPDFFHPEHLDTVVSAGKHVYCEKPAGVDVRGSKRILEIGKKADGKLSLEIGFQIRSAPPYVEWVKRIHGGALGKIACAATFYHATSNNYPPRSNMSTMELRLRNFYWDRVLSGDIIVDQAIHVIDICNWVLKAHPLAAVGSGGRGTRADWGNYWDHFDVVYTYPDDVHVSLNHFQGGSSLWDVSERFFGSKGVAEAHYSGVVGIYGDEPWEWEGSTSPATAQPGHANLYAVTRAGSAARSAGTFSNALALADAEKDKAFIESITSGKYHNQASKGVESALSAQLGRMAAYTGRKVTWDELLASNQTYDPEIEGIDLREFV